MSKTSRSRINRRSIDNNICINSSCNKKKFPDNVVYRNKEKKIIHEECKICFNKRAKLYRERNKAKLKEKQHKWYHKGGGKEHKKLYDKINLEKSNMRDKNRYATDLNFRMKKILRSRLYKVTKKGQYSKKMTEYLGIDINIFRQWIEFQFDENMSWENQGSYWHIDHVIPCKSFDLTEEEEISQCFNWENVRPLEGIENDIKNDKILPDEIKKHKKLVLKFKKKINL
ncbi:putative nuclease [Niemeyer virus]|nr:putative nuclease [Niemeyer virus]